MIRLHTVALCVAFLAIPAAALADGMTMEHAMPATSAGSPSDKAYAASMQTMMQNMDVKPTGHADADFVRMMMPHHQGAIDMAKVELQYGRDPKLRALAGDIVKAQEREIGVMKTWLAKHPGQ